MKGCVFSIEEFSVYDGPGIRTTVFLKGCPLRCEWCHNPEGQNISPEIVRSPNGCIECGNCIRNATVQNGRRYFTDKSIQSCPMHLLRVCGEEMDSADLCEKLLKNKVLLQNGGVTFSGGEPLMQSAFVFECLQRLKGKLHTAIQTCGYCDPHIFEEAVTLADYFLFDLKLADEDMHKRYTGVSNRSIIENFSWLARSGKEFVVRIPLIPSVTDTNENLTALIGILKENNVHYVELLPYNQMAGGKYALLGREYCPSFDERQPVNLPTALFETHSIAYKIL